MTPRFIEYEQVIRCNYELCQTVNFPSKIIKLNISQKSDNHIGDQRMLRRACASAQARLSFSWSHKQIMDVGEGSDRRLCILAH